MLPFVRWYNQEHRHSGLNFLTPSQRHDGSGHEIFEKRRQVYEQAKSVHPERWSREIRSWALEEEVWLNPERIEEKSTENKRTS